MLLSNYFKCDPPATGILASLTGAKRPDRVNAMVPRRTKSRGLIGNTVRTTRTGADAVAAPATVSGEPVAITDHWAFPGRSAIGRDPRARRPAIDVFEPA